MRIVVKFHHSAQPDLFRWRRTFGPRGQDRTDQFQMAVDLLRARFAELNGLPPNAARCDTPGGGRTAGNTRIEWKWSSQSQNGRGTRGGGGT